ncbi:alpha/beta hydrolase [Curtobacterium sp. MCPF17_031]|nr:alpha/beta hydrolase [Curtobacterium sp. MCPF17_031]
MQSCCCTESSMPAAHPGAWTSRSPAGCSSTAACRPSPSRCSPAHPHTTRPSLRSCPHSSGSARSAGRLPHDEGNRMTTRTDHPTVLLVQGAWHHPDAWLPLRGELFLRGVRTVVTDLPSAGTAPTGSMHDDADAVTAAIAAIAGPVVVVAHSYGGIPATEATATATGVTQLIYVAAYVPDVDGSMYTLHGVPDPEDVSGLVPTVPDPRTTFYGDLTDERAAVAVARMVEQTQRAFVERVRGAGWRSVPTTYVVCDQDQAIPPSMQAAMAAHAGATVRHLASSHSPFLSEPGALADLVLSTVSAAAV